MSEWSKEPDSKSGVVLCITEGSNPSLSVLGKSGEVSEWSKVHDWKSCMVKSHRGFESPPLRFSSRYLAMYAAQPRQGRDAAAVSGMYMRPGPFAAVFHYLQISFALHDSHVQAMAFRFF